MRWSPTWLCSLNPGYQNGHDLSCPPACLIRWRVEKPFSALQHYSTGHTGRVHEKALSISGCIPTVKMFPTEDSLGLSLFSLSYDDCLYSFLRCAHYALSNCLLSIQMEMPTPFCEPFSDYNQCMGAGCVSVWWHAPHPYTYSKDILYNSKQENGMICNDVEGILYQYSCIWVGSVPAVRYEHIDQWYTHCFTFPPLPTSINPTDVCHFRRVYFTRALGNTPDFKILW